MCISLSVKFEQIHRDETPQEQNHCVLGARTRARSVGWMHDDVVLMCDGNVVHANILSLFVFRLFVHSFPPRTCAV